MDRNHGRPKFERDLLRYASDLTFGEWKVLEPLLPPRQSAGTASTTALREVVSRHTRSTTYCVAAVHGHAWTSRHAPTVQRYFPYLGLVTTPSTFNHPTAGRGDRGQGPRGRPVGRYHRQSESASGKRRYPGLDAGKKQSQGRKRHILTDTGGLLVAVVVHGAPRSRTATARRRVRRHPPPLSPPAPRLRRRRLCRGLEGNRTEADRPLVAGAVNRPAGVSRASNSCPADGSSSARSPGSARSCRNRRWPRTSRRPSRPPRPGSSTRQHPAPHVRAFRLAPEPE